MPLQRRPTFASPILGAATLMLLALSCASCNRREASTKRTPVPGQRAGAVSLARNGRIHYPYSIVSGGVTSAEELVEASSADPIVKAHYAGISAARLKPTPLGEDRKAYVSYRVRNEVFWTSKPVSLRKGEIVLTDGENLVRGRCGNRISDTPQLPVASVVWEPDEEALNPSGIDELPVPGSLIRGWESEPSASSQPLVMATLSSPGQAGGESAALGWTPGSPFAALYGTAAYAGVGGGGGAGGGVAPGGGGGGGGSSGSAITFAGSQDTFARQAPLILYAGNQFNAGYQSIALGYEQIMVETKGGDTFAGTIRKDADDTT